ncbi:Uncharacterised protein [Campylobacter devanensis]|uniref:Uncharacterized protein n=1 Tax=Campylobacter devanensis TaxID=3161138 RepID=A0A1X9STR5_9BACT|nr:hypothetical protein [Campylobacter lanienae]ARQ99669.1 hypothetical protein CIGN_1425 [Campylobacter lanienae]SUX02913.1 Uncharacterised protein [Campylobacter lanienae]
MAFSLIEAIYQSIGETEAQKALSNINAFNQPSSLNCDSLRFIATKSFYSKFTKWLAKLNIQMHETQINDKKFNLFDLLTPQAPKIAFESKITNKITLTTYYSSISFKKARQAKRTLNNFIIIELHGLAQYNPQSKIPIKLTNPIIRILKYIFKYCDNLKERKTLNLVSFDIALDYHDNEPITKEYAINKATYLDQIHAKFFNYQGTLYIQESKAPTAKNINSNLQKIIIYSKTTKNALPYPLNRFELRFLIND